jgi:hypothetical protein
MAMTTKDPKKEKRRIEARVSQHLGARLDRLAEAYRANVAGSSFKASDALHVVLHIGIQAEETRLGLPPLPVSEEPATRQSKPAKRMKRKRTTRPRSRAGSAGV